MDKIEARKLLNEFVQKLMGQPYQELRGLLGNPRVEVITSPSGREYQVEYESLWDEKPGGALRVLVSIDDGGFFSVLKPLCDSFLIDDPNT